MNAQPAGVNWGGVVIGVTVAAFVLMVAVSWRPSQSTPTAPAAPATAPTTPDAPLTGVVLYKNRIGFNACVRAALHNCTLSWVTDASGEPTTIRIGPLDIDPVASCEGMLAGAVAACSDAGVLPAAFGGTDQAASLPWLLCAARHGMIYRGGANTGHVDPRDEDPAARPGTAVLQCDEGRKRATFDETL